MPSYRTSLPQLGGDFFLTDGGIETTLIFLDGQELPHFAAFHLFRTAEGEEVLRRYFRTYADLARQFGAGLVLETPTWRASADWGEKLGYSKAELAEVNRRSVRIVEEVRNEYTGKAPLVISGCVGPRGDGYVPDTAMSPAQAESYHGEQIGVFAETAADLVTAITMNYTNEAIGIARAAKAAKVPVVISFTVETDGKLPTGQLLGDAIRQVDDATGHYPAYFMLNCAHPSHMVPGLSGDAPWMSRIRWLRANASRMSHAELNDAPELDPGNPVELGAEYAALRKSSLKSLNVMGGCCGTDHRHVGAIAAACGPLFR